MSILKNWKGIWSRGGAEKCPSDHLISMLNMYCPDGELITRPSFRKICNLAVGNTVRNIYPIKGTGGKRFLVSTISGQLYRADIELQSVNLLTTLGGWTGDMSCVQWGSRIFVTVNNASYFLFSVNNCIDASPSVPTISSLGGAPPTGATLAVAVPGAGNIERGTHIYKVAFETVTGFITKPSTTQLVAYNSPGAETHNLSGIPTGPSGTPGVADTAARIILVTKAIGRYNGDHINQEYFFLPNGRVAGNVATTLNGVSFFDKDLVKSADYLLDQFENVPSARLLRTYNNRLVTVGDVNDRNVIRISNFEEPESFDQVDGLIETAPSSPEGVVDAFEYNDLLFILKGDKTLVTEHNDDVPSTWEVNTVDPEKSMVYNLLTTAESGRVVAKISGERALVENFVLIATTAGLYTFNGRYQLELSWKINDLWRKTFTNKNLATPTNDQPLLAFEVDNMAKLIYVQYNSSSFLICDYNKGLTPMDVRWYKWISNTNVHDMCSVADGWGRNGQVFQFGSDGNGPMVQDVFDEYHYAYPNFEALGLVDGDGPYFAVGSISAINQSLEFPFLDLDRDWINHLSLITYTMGDRNEVTWRQRIQSDSNLGGNETKNLVMVPAINKTNYNSGFNYRSHRMRLLLEILTFPVTNKSHTRIIEVQFDTKRLWRVAP